MVCNPLTTECLDSCLGKCLGCIVGDMASTFSERLGCDHIGNCHGLGRRVLNTALEAIVDLASPEMNHLAKIGKDVGAAAVLIAAAAAALIGFLLLGPPLWGKIHIFIGF